ncbi:MAG: flagellar biosynthetic protein FliR [Proteobacteria bacterium]|nr:flagellar biosynthetic protein FliR [Pseudomonadota bacterium]
MLQEFITTGVFAFILTFVRIGSAVTIMPGVGDSLTPQNIRLYIALGLSLVLSPLVAPHLPSPVPTTTMLFALIAMEFIIGLFIGTIARIFMAALDTAGMVISLASGLGNAQLFNPGFQAQGSLIGAFMSIAGVTLLFVTDMHHLLFYGIVGSYELFPVGAIPDTGNMAELMSKAVAASFMIGVQISAPFLVVSLLLYIGMGVLTRLMPQIQVFLLALPLQIILALITLSLIVSAGFLFWLSRFEENMVFFMSSGG